MVLAWVAVVVALLPNKPVVVPVVVLFGFAAVVVLPPNKFVVLAVVVFGCVVALPNRFVDVLCVFVDWIAGVVVALFTKRPVAPVVVVEVVFPPKGFVPWVVFVCVDAALLPKRPVV